MTMARSSSIGRMARAVRMSIGWGAAGAASAVAIVGFIIGPLTLLLLLAVDGYLFPVRLYAVNETIEYGSRWLPVVVCVGVLCKSSRDAWPKVRLWDHVVSQMWLAVVIGGITLGGLFFWLGTRGSWRAIIEQNDDARMTFLGLYGMAAGTSLFAVVGRAFVWAKKLVRKDRPWAATWACALGLLVFYVGEVLFWPAADVLIVAREF